MIVEKGIVVAAWGDIARKYEIHTMRKPLMSAMIGIHVNEGHIDLSKTMEELGIDDNERGTLTVGEMTPPGLVERSEKSFIISVFPGGNLSIFQGDVSLKEGFEDTGKWWFEGNKFCSQWNRLRSGKKNCVYLVIDKKTLKVYSLNGTLDSQSKIIQK